MVFTFPNADESNNKIIKKIEQFINKKKNTRKLVKSLGQSKYWNLLSQASLVIGNSSSGIIEAPVLKIPTINVGDRQKGRLKALSIIDTNHETKNIISAIKYGLSKKFLKVLGSTKSLYGVGNTSDKILEILCKKEKNLKKNIF